MMITLELLQRLNACSNGVDRFRREFGAEVFLDQNTWNMKKHLFFLHANDIDWIASHVLDYKGYLVYMDNSPSNAMTERCAEIRLAVLGALLKFYKKDIKL